MDADVQMQRLVECYGAAAASGDELEVERAKAEYRDLYARQVTRTADALEREFFELTGQTVWERPKIEAAAERIVRAAMEDDTDA